MPILIALIATATLALTSAATLRIGLCCSGEEDIIPRPTRIARVAVETTPLVPASAAKTITTSAHVEPRAAAPTVTGAKAAKKTTTSAHVELPAAAAAAHVAAPKKSSPAGLLPDAYLLALRDVESLETEEKNSAYRVLLKVHEYLKGRQASELPTEHRVVRILINALTKTGFNEAQALKLVKQKLRKLRKRR